MHKDRAYKEEKGISSGDDATARLEEPTSKVEARPRVACYCRVAHPDQLALDMQVSLNSKFAQEQGYDIVTTIAECGTGTGMDRPGLRKLLKHVEQRDFDVLIVKDLNRLGRNLSLVLPLLRALREKGIRVESPLMGTGCDLLKYLPVLQSLGEKEDLPMRWIELVGRTFSIRGVRHTCIAATDNAMLLLQYEDGGAPCQYVVVNEPHWAGEELCWLNGDYFPLPIYGTMADALAASVASFQGKTIHLEEE